MNKQEKKLLEINEQANDCTSRKEAKKLIHKADKAHAKLLLKQLLK